MHVDYGAFSFVQDGDLPVAASGDAALVVRLAAHGGKQTNAAQRLRNVQPSFVVLLTGDGNRAGDPAEETLQRLAGAGVTLYHTDRRGTTGFISDGERLWVNSER